MQVTLSGRTGRDIETFAVPRNGGKNGETINISKTSLAVNVGNEKPDWHELEFSGKALEQIASFIRKGLTISIVGNLKFNTWNDKDTGVLRSKPIVVVSEVELAPKPVS